MKGTTSVDSFASHTPVNRADEQRQGRPWRILRAEGKSERSWRQLCDPFSLARGVAGADNEADMIKRKTLVMSMALAAALAGAMAADGPDGGAGAAAAPRVLTFEHDVRPILKVACFHCHGEGEELKGGLDLRLRRLIVAGGKSGAAVTPGDPDDSELFLLVAEGDMPKGEKKLTAEQIGVIREWIAQGAATAEDEPASLGKGLHITAADRAWWSFVPVRRPDMPQVKQAERVRTPIDAFIAAKLEEAALTFNVEADKRTLIRRATFDLLGLPPTPAEAELFLADDSPDAYERLIDRLLASPHYGERWGRHWLDVAGYADSEGFTEADVPRVWAYRYRDYVIRSLNADKPWDRFITEQLAGDELLTPPYRDLNELQVELLAATGYLRMAPDGTGPGSGAEDQTAARNQVVADTIRIVSGSLLGLTVDCAQCHHHRYDPIPQEDYYRLRAVFEPALSTANWRTPNQRLVSLYTDADRAEASRIEAEAAKIDQARQEKQQQFIEQTVQKELAKLPEEIREEVRAAREAPAKDRTERQKMLLMTYPSVNVSAGSLYLYDGKAAEELKKMADEAAKIRETKPAEGFVRAMTEPADGGANVPATHVYIRGDPNQPGERVTPAGLAVLSQVCGDALPEDDASRPTTGRRLALAEYLTSGRHPLTARVLVNRVWMHHFGRGIVATPEDFGRLGEPPTHPLLLDYLADRFVAEGWRLKPLHKLIMTSTVYRQASTRHSAGEQADADNRLLWRMNLRRLDAESLRDAVLSASGAMNVQMFGPPVPVREDEVGRFVIGIENKDGENKPGAEIPLNGQEHRRSVYVQQRRTRPLSVLSAFDLPSMDPHCTRRNASTAATQSLMLMNSDFITANARQFAQRVQREGGDDAKQRAALAWRIAYAAEPTEQDLADAAGFIAEQTELFEANEATKSEAGLYALASYCQALLSSNRFLYVD